ncbi:Uncharacterized protein OBRU01_18329 [Operophtera brumata]|uniref:Uncharacterized protein n=1 Tax=Operophtera brumata TaxID=104452 RepID=A0A0L7KZ87_OPEBR|nr:Uncharacterized protein OBRU01_18329 [Operophtera brumata]
MPLFPYLPGTAVPPGLNPQSVCCRADDARKNRINRKAGATRRKPARSRHMSLGREAGALRTGRTSSRQKTARHTGHVQRPASHCAGGVEPARAAHQRAMHDTHHSTLPIKRLQGWHSGGPPTRCGASILPAVAGLALGRSAL